MIVAAKGVKVEDKNVYPLVHGIIMDASSATDSVFKHVDDANLFDVR